MEECINEFGGICSTRASGLQNCLCPYRNGNVRKCRCGVVITESMVTEYGLCVTENDLKEQDYKVNANLDIERI